MTYEYECDNCEAYMAEIRALTSTLESVRNELEQLKNVVEGVEAENAAMREAAFRMADIWAENHPHGRRVPLAYPRVKRGVLDFIKFLETIER